MPYRDDPLTPHTRLLAIVWQRSGWRCEYVKDPDSPGCLRLYRGTTLAIDRPVRSIDDMHRVAAWWRELITDPEARRARLSIERRGPAEDRRRIPRGGRRLTDLARAIDDEEEML